MKNKQNNVQITHIIRKCEYWVVNGETNICRGHDALSRVLSVICVCVFKGECVLHLTMTVPVFLTFWPGYRRHLEISGPALEVEKTVKEN